MRRLACLDVSADEVPAVRAPLAGWVAVDQQHLTVEYQRGDRDRNLDDHGGTLREASVTPRWGGRLPTTWGSERSRRQAREASRRSGPDDDDLYVTALTPGLILAGHAAHVCAELGIGRLIAAAEFRRLASGAVVGGSVELEDVFDGAVEVGGDLEG